MVASALAGLQTWAKIIGSKNPLSNFVSIAVVGLSYDGDATILLERYPGMATLSALALQKKLYLIACVDYQQDSVVAKYFRSWHLRSLL